MYSLTQFSATGTPFFPYTVASLKKGYLCSQVHDEYVLFVAKNAEN